MIKARTSLILDYPFFGVLALKLNMHIDNNVPTAGTDGRYLKYNEKWTSKLKPKERQGLIVHEVMHCALQHIARRGERDHVIWNAACDYVINGNLENQGFTLPKGGCVNHDWDDFSAEHVYNLLLEDAQKMEGYMSMGDVDDAPAPPGKDEAQSDAGPGSERSEGQQLTESQQAQIKSDWQIATQQAANAAKMQGKLPAELERLLTDVLDPLIDWKTMLYKYIHVPVKDDYNWGRPNRRFLHSGIVLPTLYSHGMGDVAVIVDTSGSISQGELNQFSGELSGICEDAKPRKVHIYYCDTRVNRHDTFELEDYPIALDAIGGGGTDMNPAFEEIQKLDQTPECIIVLTDMYLNTNHIQYPDCDTLWISTGSIPDDVKFGEVTKLNL